MIEEKIKNFLTEKPGYAKKGSNKLRAILAKKGIYASNIQVLEAINKFKKGLNTSTNIEDNSIESLIKENNLKIKSVWTKPNGELAYSYEVDKTNSSKSLIDEFRDTFLSELKEISKKSCSCQKQDLNESNENLALEISLPDFHFGKIDGLSIEEQGDKFFNSVSELVKRANHLKIDKFILPIGNDFFNTDNLNYTTTKGTPQRDNSHWQKSFRTGWNSVIKTINYLLTIAPVEVIMIAGNHDYEKNFYLGEVLDAYYIDNKLITIDNTLESPRKYVKYGVNLIGFTHGDKERLVDLPLIMATEAKELWSTCSKFEWHIGHTHKHVHNEYQGVAVKVLPSLTGQDEWHKMYGYSSLKRAQAYIWNKETGLEGFIQING
jgi:hypothetical protein